MLFQNNPPPPNDPSPPPPPPPPSELIFPDQAEGSSDCPLPPPPSPSVGGQPGRRRALLLPPSIRISSEFDSESSLLSNKVSWRIFNGVAKIRTQFQRNKKGEVSKPRVGFITKHLSLLYDVEERNGFVSGLFNIGKSVLVEGDHNLKEKHGLLKVVAALPDPSYKVELLSPFPSVGLPRAALKFPHGEIRVEAKGDEIQKALSALSFSGILRGNMMNGLCAAQFKDEALHLRYSYKDKEVTFTPSIYLPSNVLSLAFKRRFSPSDKLSYWYNFSSNNWSTVYKHTFGDDFKVKAGYDSDVNLGWASLWVGKEQAGAKTAPMKVKFQVMLQVPKDRMNEPALMFRVKKRWDI